MRYFMFIDESGEANINNPDPRFNIFVLCGIVFTENDYNIFNDNFKKLKEKYFNSNSVIFHSFKMRNKSGIYKIFQNDDVLKEFYIDIGKILSQSRYKIISCVVNKEKYSIKYPTYNNAYEDSLTFLCERAILMIGRKNKIDRLHICLEKREKRKNAFLKSHYTKIIKYGTQYISTDEFKMCHPKLYFRGKEENINGLQLADICAYPIARKMLSPEKPQPTFDIFESKFYCNMYGSYAGLGLKIFP